MRGKTHISLAVALALMAAPPSVSQPPPAATPSPSTTDQVIITGKAVEDWRKLRQDKEDLFHKLDEKDLCPAGFEADLRGYACAIITYDVLLGDRVVGQCNAPIFRLMLGGPISIADGIMAGMQGDFIAAAYRQLPCPADAKKRDLAYITLESLVRPPQKTTSVLTMKVRQIVGYQQLKQDCAKPDADQKECSEGLRLFDYKDRLSQCSLSVIWGPPLSACKGLRGQ